jgi:hypothetical protein
VHVQKKKLMDDDEEDDEYNPYATAQSSEPASHKQDDYTYKPAYETSSASKEAVEATQSSEVY